MAMAGPYFPIQSLCMRRVEQLYHIQANMRVNCCLYWVELRESIVPSWYLLYNNNNY